MAVAETSRAAMLASNQGDQHRAIAVAAADAGQDLHQMPIASDTALYEAKRRGRNRVVPQVTAPA